MAYKPKGPREEEPQPQPEPPPAAAEPGISVQAFQAFQEQVSGTLSQVTRTLEALATRQPQAPAPAAYASPTVADITDEEIEHALVSGEGGAKAIRRAVEVEANRLVRERIVPLEQFGVTTFNDLTDRIVGKDLKHYGLLKKEIDAQLSQMDPALRANPRSRELAYKLALAENFDRVLDTEIEAKLRQRSDGEETDLTQDRGSGGDRKPRAAAPPSVADVFGGEGTKALRAVNRDLDAMARKMGYKGGADEYLKLAAQMESEEA